MAEAVFLRPWENRVCLLGGTELSLLPPRPGPAAPPMEGPDSSGGPLVAGGAVLVGPSVERLQVEVVRLSLLLNSIHPVPAPGGCPGWGAATLRSLVVWPLGGSIFILLLMGAGSLLLSSALSSSTSLPGGAR